MNYANLVASHVPDQQVLHRVEKSILIAAAVLAIAAFVAHHAGISAAVALVAALAVTLIERIKGLPTAHAPHYQLKTQYRYADGGSFRAGEFEKKSPAKRPAVVLDGGTKH